MFELSQEILDEIEDDCDNFIYRIENGYYPKYILVSAEEAKDDSKYTAIG